MSDPLIKTYEIDGQTYELMPPCYGVMERVVLFNMRVTEAVVDFSDIIPALGASGPDFVAELIRLEGVHPDDRDISAVAKVLRWEHSTLLDGIVDDFFEQPGASDKEIRAASGLIVRLKAMMLGERPGATLTTPSPEKSASSQEVTSSNEAKSDGISVPVTSETT